YESRRAFALLAVGDEFPPFFAGQNVPSAMSCFQSMCPSSSARSTSLAQTSVRSPEVVHSINRLRKVDSDGKYFGKSCQRPPFRSSQSRPSKQGRGGTGGRPPGRCGGFQGNKSSIRNHWSSVICGLTSVVDARSYRP